MHTLSRYDIADVVSHISSKTGTSGAENKEGASFDVLLTKAVNSIPDPNTEGKVAESGKNPPDFVSALKQTLQKSGGSVKSLEDKHHSDLDTAALGSFYRGQVLSNSSELLSQEEIGADSKHRIDFEEHPDILSHLNVLKIELENTNKIGQNRPVISGEEKTVISGKLVRVTTLKHKRPVILGPEGVDNKIKSESGREGFVDSLSNYYQDDARASNINFGKEGQKSDRENHLAVSSPKFKEKIEISKEFTNSHNLNSNKTKEYSEDQSLSKLPKLDGERDQSLSKLPKLDGEREQSLSKLPKLDGERDQSLSKLPKLNGEGGREVIEGKYVDFGDKDQKINRRNYTAVVPPKFREEMTDSRIYSENQGLSSHAGVLKNNELVSGEKHELFQPKERLEILEANNKGLSSKNKSTNERPKAEEPKISEPRGKSEQQYTSFEKLSPEAKYLTRSYSDSEAKNIDNEANNYNKNQQNSYLTNENKYGMPDKGNGGSVNQPAEAFGGKYEFKELSGKSYTEPKINNSVEILIKNEKIVPKTDLLREAGISNNLAQTNIDSNISGVKNQSIEVANQELFSSNQLEKLPVLNRSEILSKPVSVSNFNSEIRELIVGQLTKSVNGVSKFKVALYPENFGKVSVEISYSESAGLKINMIGDNPEATRVLEQNLPSLRENLQSEKLSELIVNLNNNRESQGFNNKNNKSKNENDGDNAGKEPASVELVESSSTHIQENLTLGSGNGLDTYV